MTTKEQEREALKKIRKIVEELGENSYVGTAFEGCFRDAEDNIEDDAAYSMKSRFEYSEEKLAAAQFYSGLQDKLVEILEERVRNCDTKCFDITQQLITAEPDDFQRLQEKAKKVMVDRANYSSTLQQVQAIKCE